MNPVGASSSFSSPSISAAHSRNNSSANRQETQHAEARTGNGILRAIKSQILPVFLVSTYIAAAVGYRAARQPAHMDKMVEDFTASPTDFIISVLRFIPRCEEQTLQDAQEKILDQFGDYIDPNHACFKAIASCSNNLPSGASGLFKIKENVLEIANNHQYGLESPVAHEYLHCFTHPGFRDFLKKNIEGRPDIRQAINEGITHYLTRQVPISPGHFHLAGYDYLRFPGHKSLTMVGAAKKIANSIGEVTLMQAYFGGRPEALKKLDEAVFNILPKRVTPKAWNALQNIEESGRISEKLVDAYIGAVLIHLPAQMNNLVQLLQKFPAGDVAHLVTQLSDAAKQFKINDSRRPQHMLQTLLTEALAARKQFGERKFDVMFCKSNLDDGNRKKMMLDFVQLWKPVLPSELSKMLSKMLVSPSKEGPPMSLAPPSALSTMSRSANQNVPPMTPARFSEL